MPDEINEAERNAIAALHQSLWDDPDVGPEFKKLIAKKHPKAREKMPDLMAREAVDAELVTLRKERDEDRKEREAERNARLLEQRRRKMTEGFTARDGSTVRLSPEDIPNVEKLMLEEGIADHETAAFLFETSRRVAAPRASYSSRAEIPGVNGAGGDDYKWIVPGVNGDRTALDQVTRDQANRIWDDLRNGRNRDKWLAGM